MLVVERAPVSIRALLGHRVDMAAAPADRTGVALVLDAPQELAGNVDSDRIRQAVDNLLDNALRIAPAGSQIVISARAVGPDVMVSVADSGLGFAADYLPHAFERFSRPSGGRSRADGGAGLGLAIVSATAAAHCGEARAANRAEGGAVVMMRLPRTDS